MPEDPHARARLPHASRRLPAIATACALLPAFAHAADYFVGAETHLTADRWRGTRPDPIERLDVRPRLRLGIFDIEDDGAETDRYRFLADLDVGTDFGRTDAERELTRTQLGDTRRAAFDLHMAYFEATPVTSRDFELSARVGRHLLMDEIGLDAVDGATVRVRVPYVVLEGTGGLAVRSGWSNLGPDIYSPDGTALSEGPAYVAGGALETAIADWVSFRGAYRRQFEDASHLQREETGGGLELTLLPGFSVTGGARYDVIYRRLSSVHAGLGISFLEAWRTELAWRREHPTFSADSIWNAFSIEPYNDLTARLRWDPSLWRLSLDGGVRQFSGGDLHEGASGFDTSKRAYDGGVRAERLMGAVADDASVGAEGRAGLGYGGQRIYGDLFGRMPVALTPGVAPLRLSGRLGAVQFEDEQQARLTGVSGWAVVSTAWKATETVNLELLGEGHSSKFTPFRGRILAQVTLEDWL